MYDLKHTWRKPRCCILLMVLALQGVAAASPNAALAAAGVADSASAPLSAGELANDGVVAYEDAQFDLAKEKLSLAFQSLPAPTIALWLARTELKRNDLVAAANWYKRVAELSTALGKVELQQQAQRDAAAELTSLLPKLPRIHVDFTGCASADAVVKINGTITELSSSGDVTALNPGQFAVECEHAGHTVAHRVELAESDTKTIACEFPIATTPATQPQPSAVSSTSEAQRAPRSDLRTIVTYSALGAGALGVLVGTITGIIAVSKSHSLDGKGCSNGHCDPALASDVASLNRLRPISTAGFIVGGIGLASGVTLYLTAPKQEAAPVAVFLGPQFVGMRGSF
jgi:hypothetical protein